MGPPVHNNGGDDGRSILPPRLLKRPRDETDAKSESADDTPAPADDSALSSKMPSNAGTAKHVWHVGEALVHTPPPLPAPHAVPPGTSWSSSSPTFASSASHGGGESTTASRGSSRHHKGKSRKISTGICNERLDEAYNLTKGGVIDNIIEPEDVTKLCSLVTPSSNLGCPFVFFPANYNDTGRYPPTNYFPRGVKEYEDLFLKLFGGVCGEDIAKGVGKALASVALYCSCHQAYDLGCSNELPSTPQEKDEYCEFAGVWNGDFSSTDVELSLETTDCGCFWISEVTKEVGNCPGVDLGFFYPFPYPPQLCPYNKTGTLGAFRAFNPS
jgi:hypothetical protein